MDTIDYIDYSQDVNIIRYIGRVWMIASSIFSVSARSVQTERSGPKSGCFDEISLSKGGRRGISSASRIRHRQARRLRGNWKILPSVCNHLGWRRPPAI